MHESEKWKWSCSVVSNSSDPMDCSLPGSSIHGIFQAKVLEWGAIAFSDSGGLEGFKQYQVKEREADSLVRDLEVERVRWAWKLRISAGFSSPGTMEEGCDHYRQDQWGKH